MAKNQTTVYHIISRGKRWAIRKDDAKRASKIFDRPCEALWHTIGLEGIKTIYIHRKDGTVIGRFQSW
ncbi:MAG: hypothetical protein PHT07_15635 [Paludibacter sp.]|nr:hypothetical protein [Paludibacter sp.]